VSFAEGIGNVKSLMRWRALRDSNSRPSDS
jgi:hypothetical protein